LNKRIRNAEVNKVPYVLVVGDREAAQETVAVRKKGEGDKGAIPLSQFIDNIKQQIAQRQ
jgi:threonyl-tRNA synthetase